MKEMIISNMSYCRFKNTHQDLVDCYNALVYGLDIDELSESERKYAKKLIQLCADIGDDFA